MCWIPCSQVCVRVFDCNKFLRVVSIQQGALRKNGKPSEGVGNQLQKSNRKVWTVLVHYLLTMLHIRLSAWLFLTCINKARTVWMSVPTNLKVCHFTLERPVVRREQIVEETAWSNDESKGQCKELERNDDSVKLNRKVSCVLFYL